MNPSGGGASKSCLSCNLGKPGGRACNRLIETVRLGAAVAVASGEVRWGWLPNRLPARVRLASDRCACPVGPRRDVARKRDERPAQVRYKACPPRPAQSDVEVECA